MPLTITNIEILDDLSRTVEMYPDRHGGVFDVYVCLRVQNIQIAFDADCNMTLYDNPFAPLVLLSAEIVDVLSFDCD